MWKFWFRNVTSLPKVIWEEGRVASLLHTYAAKSPLVTMVHPKCAPKSTPSRGPIAKPQYLPHPWTHATYDAKRHPDPIRRFFTMHWTDRRTDRPTDCHRESLTTIGRCATRATRPKNLQQNVTSLTKRLHHVFSLLWANALIYHTVCATGNITGNSP